MKGGGVVDERGKGTRIIIFKISIGVGYAMLLQCSTSSMQLTNKCSHSSDDMGKVGEGFPV